MKRYIALDVGKARTGIALVDDQARVGTPLSVISVSTDSPEFIRQLKDIVQEWEAIGLVFGLPIDLKGKEAIAAQNVRQIADKIHNNIQKVLTEPIEIHFVDERLTTAQAEKAMINAEMSAEQRKKYRDSLAASLIAQSFADRL